MAKDQQHSTANSLSASEKFLADDDFESITSEVNSLEYVAGSGQRFLCLDTPGVFDTKLTVPELAARISKFTLQAPEGLDALAVVIRRGRMTEEELYNLISLAQIERLFGAEVWNHAVTILTHCKDTLDKLKADLTKLGENHILIKIIEKAKHRVGKIDNVTRKPEQLRILQADVDHIHLLLARVSIEKWENGIAVGAAAKPKENQGCHISAQGEVHELAG